MSFENDYKIKAPKLLNAHLKGSIKGSHEGQLHQLLFYNLNDQQCYENLTNHDLSKNDSFKNWSVEVTICQKIGLSNIYQKSTFCRMTLLTKIY